MANIKKQTASGGLFFCFQMKLRVAFFATIGEGGMIMETLTIGRIKLTWLNGGVTHMDGGAMFGVVPKPLWSKKV